MGGTVATLFAGTFPESVRSLISLEGLGPPDNDPSVGPDRMRQWIEQVRAERVRSAAKDMTPDEAFARLRMNHARVPEATLRRVITHLLRPGDAPGSVQWCFDPLHRTRAPMPFQSVLLKAFIARVTAPVLFVDGGPAGFHPPDEEVRLAAFASLRRATIEGAGHMMHWTHPQELAEVVLSFLGALPTA
jgi:pimeloyl-ACP methyl ester carboxylesterase